MCNVLTVMNGNISRKDVNLYLYQEELVQAMHQDSSLGLAYLLRVLRIHFVASDVPVQH
jgi:hypothetical protein